MGRRTCPDRFRGPMVSGGVPVERWRGIAAAGASKEMESQKRTLL